MAKRGYKLQELIAHSSNIKCMDIGKKSCRIFVTGGEDKKVNVWAIGKSDSLLSLSGHTSPIESVTFDSSEVLVLGGSSSGTIKLWDLEDAKAVRTLSGHRSKCSSLEFHPFGEFCASGSSDADLKIWDIRKKGCIHTYKGHTKGITTIRFTPDGRWLVSGGEDNVVKLWDLTAGKPLHDFKFHNGAIRSIDFHPHEFLLATGSADRTVKFWDLETFELIGSAGPEVTGVRSMIFHPDGKTLFCGLEQTLKVFSWEPVRCHDDVDIGWSVLGDLSIYEGKLLGCSYHERCVGVWVADISLIAPYTAGGFSKSNAFVEPDFKIVAGHGLDSFSVYSNDTDDQRIDTKEIIHTECRTLSIPFSDEPDDSSEKSFERVSSIKVPKESQKRLPVSKENKAISSFVGNQTFGMRSMSKSSIGSLTSSKDGDSIEEKAGTTKITRSNLSRKGAMTKSSGLRGNGVSSIRKDFTMDSRKGSKSQANKTVYTPVVVMRDAEDFPKTKGKHETSLPETDANDTLLCGASHSRKSSFDDIGHETQLVSDMSESLGRSSDVASISMNTKYRPRSGGGRGTDSEQDNDGDIKTTTESFQRVFFLDPCFGTRQAKDPELPQIITDPSSAKTVNNKDLDSPCSTTEANSIKYVRGVAVQHGRTRSLVESWEKREKFSNNRTTIDSSSNMTTQASDPLIPPKEQVQCFILEDDAIASSLTQSGDQFINIIKSRLTKLQMVRHCWQQNGIKGAINSVAKLPDLSVQVDVIGVLLEQANFITLDLFSCLLPILLGLLNSKTERHIDISLEMLLKLVKLFWPVVHSTVSAYSPVGVDIEAEERVNRCRQIFNQFENIRQILPSLFSRKGSIARRALELNLALQC